MTLGLLARKSCSGLLGLLLVCSVLGCEEEAVTIPLAVCIPVLDSLEPAEGSVDGDTAVTINGLFVGTDLGERDVQIFVGGQEAEVTGVFRGPGCEVCDACIEQALRCGECESVCRGLDSWEDPSTGEVSEPVLCEEWVSFLTPSAEEPGPAELVLMNSRGSEDGLQFLYTEASPSDDDDSAN